MGIYTTVRAEGADIQFKTGEPDSLEILDLGAQSKHWTTGNWIGGFPDVDGVYAGLSHGEHGFRDWLVAVKDKTVVEVAQLPRLSRHRRMSEEEVDIHEKSVDDMWEKAWALAKKYGISVEL